MAEFRSMVLTNKGRELLSKIIAGQGTMDFTKVSLSSLGYEDADIPDIEDIAGVVQNITNLVVSHNGAVVEVKAAANNTNVKESYYLRSIALYARDPGTNVEILYGVACANNPGYVPAYNNGTVLSGININLVTSISDAESVTLTADTGDNATVHDLAALQNQISALQRIVGVEDGDMYGVEVDFLNKKFTRLGGAVGKNGGGDFDGIKAYQRRRCIVTDDGVVLAYYGDDGYTETGATGKDIVQDETLYEAGTHVQVMVEQPKFYYMVEPTSLEKTEDGRGYHLRRARYYISDYLKPGFKLHPAFISPDDTELEAIYLSAFETCLYSLSTDSNTGELIGYVANANITPNPARDKLSSVAGSKPLVDHNKSGNASLSVFRNLANNRGDGWRVQYAATLAATQILALIEYATFDMQSAIGSGYAKSGKGVVASNALSAGGTSDLGNSSTLPSDTNSAKYVSYRGEENLWGNVAAVLDGFAVVSDGDTRVVCVTNVNFDADPMGGYTHTAIPAVRSASAAYISAFGYAKDFDWLFVPSECNGGNSAAPVGDGCWAGSWDTTFRALIGGTRKGFGTVAGLFCINMVVTDTSVSTNATNARMVYIPQN